MIGSSSNNEPANRCIRQKSQEASLSSDENDQKQLPRNLIRKNSMAENQILEFEKNSNRESTNFNADCPSTSCRKQSPANSATKQNAANYIDALRLTFDDLNLLDDISGNNISERVSKMLENQQFSDVVFVVGKGNECERIYAHKFVLSIGSEVFGAMLNSLNFHRTTTENPLQQQVEIKDIEPEIFKVILKFLYTDTIKLDPDNVMEVLYTARKYAISSLENSCINFLKNNLSAENAVMILKQARFFDLYDLADAAMEFINHDATEILQSESFIEIDQQTLNAILQKNTLRVKELTIFKTVVRWAEAQCRKNGVEIADTNLREILGDLLFQIRFPLMTLEEFSSIAQFSNILTDKEKVDIFVYFTSPVKPEIPFVQEKRCEIFGKEMVVNRFQRIESRWGYTGSPDRIKFTVDVPIYITAIGLFGAMHGEQQYETKIKITDFSTNKILAANELIFKSDGSPETFKVAFKEPIEVSPGCTYVISAQLKGPDSWFGSKGLRRISRQSIIGNTTGVITFQFSYAAGANNGTSVDDGQIAEIYFCVKVT